MAAQALCLIVAAIVLVALHQPAAGVAFSRDGDRIKAVATDGRVIARLAPNAPVVFAAGAQRLVQSAQALVSEFVPSGSFRDVSRWYADRDRLAEILRSPSARLQIAEAGIAVDRPLALRERSIGNLPLDVWLLLAEACGVGLIGSWMFALRPNDAAVRLFTLSCFGIALAAFSGALADARDLTADAILLRVALSFNIIGSNIGPASLLGVFLMQPRRIVSWSSVVAMIGAAAVWGLGVGVGVVPMAAYYAGLLAMTAALVGALATQWVLAKGQPSDRAVIRWVGLTALVGSGALALAMVGKQLLGGSSLGGDGLSILPIFIVYGGIAFGVGRYRVFDLDRWAYRVVVGALGAGALLLIDAGLILGLRIEARAALGLSILLIGYLYFPVRARVWRWFAGRPRLSEAELFQGASEVAFLPGAPQRRAGWRDLLQRLFDPLDIAAAEAAVKDVEVAADGVALLIPPAADEGALVLRYRNRGRLLFDSGQAALAAELVRFMRRAERTREAYARGAAEERRRLARDLHDDVSGRLLTGLRRADAAAIRDDVRTALADIRTILRGLGGEVLPLSQMIANMRHETFERLDAAGVRLEWPVEMAPAHDPMLNYLHYRNITSAHREVVTNILRHSGAALVRVRYAVEDGVFSLTVADNGKGLAPTHAAESASEGRGLANIRRRLAELGGGAVIEDARPGLRVRFTAAITKA